MATLQKPQIFFKLSYNNKLIIVLAVFFKFQ